MRVHQARPPLPIPPVRYNRSWSVIANRAYHAKLFEPSRYLELDQTLSDNNISYKVQFMHTSIFVERDSTGWELQEESNWPNSGVVFTRRPFITIKDNSYSLCCSVRNLGLLTSDMCIHV